MHKDFFNEDEEIVEESSVDESDTEDEDYFPEEAAHSDKSDNLPSVKKTSAYETIISALKAIGLETATESNSIAKTSSPMPSDQTLKNITVSEQTIISRQEEEIIESPILK